MPPKTDPVDCREADDAQAEPSTPRRQASSAGDVNEFPAG